MSDDFKERQKKFDKAMSEWTPEELQAHLAALDDHYSGGSVNGLIGDFSWDKQHKYHWHRLDEGSDLKLQQRMAIGYRAAPASVIDRAGISMTAKATKLDGQSVVIANHKSSKALLLRISIELFELNRVHKERLRAAKPQRDYKGNVVDVKSGRTGEGYISHVDEGVVSIDDLK